MKGKAIFINDNFIRSLSQIWSLRHYDQDTTALFGIAIDGTVDAAGVCLIQGQSGEYYIDGLNVARCCRRKGYSHRVLKDLTSLADIHDVRLSLFVADFDGIIGEPKLIEVYSRYHFEITRQDPLTGETDMLRHPQQVEFNHLAMKPMQTSKDHNIER